MNKIKKYLLNLWYGLPFGMKAAGDEIIGAGDADTANEINPAGDRPEGCKTPSEG